MNKFSVARLGYYKFILQTFTTLIYHFIIRWHTSLKKKMHRQNIDKRRKIEHDTDTNIESIQMYLSSEIRTDLLNGIIQYNPKVKLSKNDYYKYRAALIGEIIFRNSQRAGVAIGLRTSEVKSGKSNGDVLKIVVHEHKTGKIKPAVIFMEESAKEAILSFEEHIRPQMANSKSKDYFFISHIGNIIKHEGIQLSLNMLTKMVGAKGKITSTASRKAAATFIAKSNPKKTQIVADFMQHQHNTAEKYYRQLGGGDHLVEAFEEIGKLKDLPSSTD